jgi:UDPglucose 6-dehydrogenase
MVSNTGDVSRLSVIGLGKLGSPMAAVFAASGFEVVGVDRAPAFVDALNAGVAPVDEPGLQELLTTHRRRLRATLELEEAVLASDISFIIVPTPSGADHFFVNDYVIAAVRDIGQALRRKPGDHLIVVTSTVMPRSTGGPIRAVLEEASGRTVGIDVGLCYSPEFIALGSVVRDLQYPDMVLIGECDARYGEMLERVYRAVTRSNPRVQRMNFVNAELCKIAVNTFVTTKISYANMLSELCEHLPEADVDVVAEAVGSDSRIGVKYLKGGVAYGGPCFPRDNKAFAALAQSLDVRADIADATDRINDHQVHRLFGAVEATVPRGSRVAVIGLSYKINTSVVEKSQGMALAGLLLSEGYRVLLADPLGAGPARDTLGEGAEIASDFREAVTGADMVVITTPFRELRDLPQDAFARSGASLPVLDPWGVLADTPIATAARVLSPGRSPKNAANQRSQAAPVSTIV